MTTGERWEEVGESGTHWSRLLVSDSRPADAVRARGFFYERYRGVVHALFLRRGLTDEEATEAVQEFFVSALARGFLESADPSRGRFRSYLRTSAENYLKNRFRAEDRRRRRLDHLQYRNSTVPPANPPVDEFEREYAQALLDAANRRLAAAASGRPRGELDVRVFEMRFLEQESPAAIARTLDLPVEEVYSAIRWAKERFGKILREEVAATVGEGEVDAELAHLRDLFGATR